MKKTFLLSLLAFTLSSPAWAWYDFEVNGIYYTIRSKSDLTCAVTGLYTSDSPNSNENTYTGKVDIPKTVKYSNNTYSVVAIDYRAFYGCTSLTEVTIPNSVTSIGNYAFYNCSSLTEVTIPNSVTSIGEGMFMDCSSLMEATIPNSVTSIGYRAFYGCTSLEKVAFNATACSSVGSNAIFYNCVQLSIVEIGENVTMIPAYLFHGYSYSGITEIILPEKLKSVGNRAFDGCSNLSIVTSLNPNPPTCEGFYSNFSSDTYNGILYVPLGTTKVYAKASEWKEFKNIVPLEDPIPPIVTTIEATEINYTSATLNGSITLGNEETLELGFEYRADGFRYGSSITTSISEEGIFSATLNDCLYDDYKYYYRAYAETDSGTYYGEELSFTTDAYVNVNGIDGIATDGAEIVGYYSTDGQQITSPTKGVNIVRLSDGTTKKVLVK